MFARGPRPGWFVWGNQADDYLISWDTYKNNSQTLPMPRNGKANSQLRLWETENGD